MTAALALDCCERAASRAVRLATVVTCSCGAVLVPPRDSGAIAQEILRLLDDEKARTALGAAARERVEENFSWAAVAAKTVAAYQRAIDQNDQNQVAAEGDQ